jgi:hypothetical protein
MDGSFLLGIWSDGITPLTEDVSFHIGNVSFTIPAGSFVRDSSGDFIFNGDINGVTLDVKISYNNNNRFIFLIHGIGANNLPGENPVMLKLSIGNDIGNIAAIAEFN